VTSLKREETTSLPERLFLLPKKLVVALFLMVEKMECHSWWPIISLSFLGGSFRSGVEKGVGGCQEGKKFLSQPLF